MQHPSHTEQLRLSVTRCASAHDSSSSDTHLSDPPLPLHWRLQLDGGGGDTGGSGGSGGAGGDCKMRTYEMTEDGPDEGPCMTPGALVELQLP